MIKYFFSAILLFINVGLFAQTDGQRFKTRNITADVTKVKGNHSKVFKECVGAGRANEGLRADWQQQLKMVQDEIGFKYIRFHGLLGDDMGVYQEDKKGNPIYNYQYIDVLFDYLLSVKIKPFVELGFMPSALASGTETQFWYKGNITQPKSYDKWADLIKNLVTHLEQRYGREEVKTWYFEVWNEPDLPAFFKGTMQDYFHLYDVTVKAIKEVSAEYRVGGPASAKAFRYETEFVKHCAENQVPVDFVSTHSYGVKGGYFNEAGDQGVVLDQDKNSIIGRMKRSRELVSKSPLPNLELHFTEWNSSYDFGDPVMDSYHATALILSKIKGVERTANSMSFWTFTDIFEEHGPMPTPFYGGFGMLNQQGIKKSSYMAYQFLAQLGNTELLNADPDSYICKGADGSIQVLYWDFTLTRPKDSVNNQVYYKRDLPSKPTNDVLLSLTNLKDGKYRLQIHQTGYMVNDAFGIYKSWGSPSQLTRAQVASLKERTTGKPIRTEIVTVKNGKFSKQMKMRENDVFLLKLKKI